MELKNCEICNGYTEHTTLKNEIISRYRKLIIIVTQCTKCLTIIKSEKEVINEKVKSPLEDDHG